MNDHGSHLGHVTSTVSINVGPFISPRSNMSFDIRLYSDVGPKAILNYLKDK